MNDAPVRLEAGAAAPGFTLSDQDGNPVALTDFAGRRVILYFYPAAMTPGCTTQACDFRDSLSAFAAEGYAVFGVSPDEPPKLQRFRERDGITFPLLSDPERQVHRAYGAWGEKNSYGRIVTGVIRSTFVIDEDGRIQLPLYNVKATGHVAMLRKRLGLDAA